MAPQIEFQTRSRSLREKEADRPCRWLGLQLQPPPINLFLPEKGNIIGGERLGLGGGAAGDTERKRRLSHVHSVLILRPTKES